jgi:uncharacterized membrane protein YgaE (UPF0421/DUF939 family)
LDFAPKEYETQLQVYEAEVRNHIKVEQQLKLHIEVLTEKIDDLEKEREKFKIIMQDGLRNQELKLKGEAHKQLESKQAEVDKLTKMLRQKHDQIASQSAERSFPAKQDHSTSQVKVVRVNNFI